MRALLPVLFGLRTVVSRRGRVAPQLVGAVLGISLSLIPLVVVLQVADGMIEGITRRYLEVGTYHLQVTLAGRAELAEYLELQSRLRDIEGVTQVVLERQGVGILYTPTGRSAVTVRAVPADLYAVDEGFRRFFTVQAGAFDLETPGAILLGTEVAARLGVSVGAEVKLLTTAGREGRAGPRMLPVLTTMRVQGIFSTGYQELDKLWSYIPLQRGVRILPVDSSRQFLGVKVSEPFRDLEQQVGRIRARLPASAHVYTWYELEKANYKSFQTTKALLVFIMILIVLVASVNISSALVMVVLERLPELAIMKAMGMPPGGLAAGFLFAGLGAGVLGCLIGLGLGLAVAVNINDVFRGVEGLLNAVAAAVRFLLHPFGGAQGTARLRVFNSEFYLEEIPIRIRPAGVAAVAALTLALSTLAAALPARAAARVHPLEVLRKV
jgi:lipoprotein-releasing system permease protein